MSRQQHRPPGPRGIFGTSQLLFLRRHPDTFLALARKYGDLVYFKVGPREVFLVSRPGLIEQIFQDHYSHFEKDWGPRRGHSVFRNGLVTSEGVDHRGQRLHASKLLSRKRIEASRPAIAEVIEAWSSKKREGEPVEVLHEMSVLSVDIATRVLFGCRLDADAVLEAVQAVARGFQGFMFPYADRVHFFRRSPASKIQPLVEQIRRSQSDHGAEQGLLAPLLSGEIDAGIHSDDQIATFLIAGQETIRIATSWSWFLLSSHPAAREKLLAEARLNSNQPVAVPPRSPFAEAVLLESMRLYPPQWMIGRKPRTSYTLDGYDILPGALILMSPYIVQRDPSFFPEAEKFIPERWLNPRPGPPMGYSYFPFGGGPRRCIGESLAVTEGTLMLSLIARDWNFDCNPADGSYDARLTLRPRSIRAHLRAVRASAHQPVSDSQRQSSDDRPTRQTHL